MEQIGTILAMIFVFVCSHFFDKWKQKRDEKNKAENLPILLNKEALIREKIQNKIIKLQGYTGANRVNLFEYTNGSYTHSGISLQYSQCTYECTDDTTVGLLSTFKNVPIGEFMPILNNLNDSKKGWTIVTTKDENVAIANIQKKYRTQSSYCFRLTDVVWDGVVLLGWVHEQKCLSEEMLNEIKIIVSQISELQLKLKR